MTNCLRWMIRLNMVVTISVMVYLGAQAQNVSSFNNVHAQATYLQNPTPHTNSNNVITPKLITAPTLADKQEVSSINSLIITKLNNPLSYQAHVSDFKITPNGEYVVFIVSQVGDDDGLWSVPLTGGNPIQINGPLDYSDYVISFHISSDSQWVVYTAYYDGDWQIFSVPILGGTVVQLNPPLVNGGNVYPNDWEYEISPDSTRVVYVADQDTDEVLELYSVPIIGGTVTKLNGPIIAGGDISRTSSSAYWFDISSNSQRVVYSADQEVDNDFELYSVPIGGGTAIKLNSPLATSTISGDVIGDVHTYQISINGTEVIYIAYLEGDDGIELHRVPITGGTTASFEGTPTFLGSLDLRLSLSEDGSRVVYHPRKDQLFSVPLSGETSIQLNNPILGDVIDFAITPDSEYVVYTASRSESYEFIRELFSVPIAGGSSLRLHEPFGPGGTVFSFWEISPDSTHVVFVAEPENSDSKGVYSASISQGTAVNIGTSASFFPSYHFAISPNSERVAYVAEITNGIEELFRTPIAGGESVKLNPPPANSLADVYDKSFEFSPNSACVVFIFTTGASGQELYSACEYNFEFALYLPIIQK